jgi:hypothetical protein
MMRLVNLPAADREPLVMCIKLKIMLLISVLACMFGCALAEAPSQNRATQEENRQVYEIYQKYMQSLNAEREMSGLPPKPIRSYEDWQKAPGTD